ncbi:MAG TPA: matrixin family metalloprotease [Solirubrobacteraceae bacterium]|nr:matrixin family metalloprotease [Solirubrobacteraceae bacterium]
MTQILEGDAEARRFTLGYELLRKADGWSVARTLEARMAWTTAPPGSPSPDDFLRGKVRDDHGTVVGSLTMCWVSPYLRRATVEIDRVPDAERPLRTAAGVGWRDVLDQVGWDLTVVESDADIQAPTGESWSNAELHYVMQQRRQAVDLDREWHYWLLCVRRLKAADADRGIMFDRTPDDANRVPREGAAIASHWMVPDEELWGTIRGARFGTTDQYLRTAVHEIGHAMGLRHNDRELGIMMPTDGLAKHARKAQEAGGSEHFPENTNWSYAADDQKRLRHWPDPIVRPGGQSYGAYDTAPVLPDDEQVEPAGVELAVSPMLASVPLGAPVRVDLELSNEASIAVPTDLSLAAGHISGTVTDPSGTVRAFRSIIHCVDNDSVGDAQRSAGSMTLLRGTDGALFPSAGAHTVHVDVRWDAGGVAYAVRGEGAVTVTDAVDAAHAETAERVLSTPDALLTLALGGDHLPAGQEAIAAALDNEVLRPHFAYIEAKRIAKPFFDRPGDPAGAAALIGDDAVMSRTEAAKAAGWTSRRVRKRLAP